VTRRGTAIALAVLTSVLVASCSAAPLGSLSTSDLPSGWGLQQTTWPFARSAVAPFGCKTSYVVAFAPPGRSFVRYSETAAMPYIELGSFAATCGSVANTKHVFDQITVGSLPPPGKTPTTIHGIGDLARLTPLDTPTGRGDLVYWRSGNSLGEVGVQGPPDDTRITPAIAEDLARRAVGSS
jgi:hypothetical protein